MYSSCCVNIAIGIENNCFNGFECTLDTVVYPVLYYAQVEPFACSLPWCKLRPSQYYYFGTTLFFLEYIPIGYLSTNT